MFDKGMDISLHICHIHDTLYRFLPQCLDALIF